MLSPHLGLNLHLWPSPPPLHHEENQAISGHASFSCKLLALSADLVPLSIIRNLSTSVVSLLTKIWRVKYTCMHSCLQAVASGSSDSPRQWDDLL